MPHHVWPHKRERSFYTKKGISEEEPQSDPCQPWRVSKLWGLRSEISCRQQHLAGSQPVTTSHNFTGKRQSRPHMMSRLQFARSHTRGLRSQLKVWWDQNCIPSVTHRCGCIMLKISERRGWNEYSGMMGNLGERNLMWTVRNIKLLEE